MSDKRGFEGLVPNPRKDFYVGTHKVSNVYEPDFIQEVEPFVEDDPWDDDDDTTITGRAFIKNYDD
jgi:hypothetical protein